MLAAAVIKVDDMLTELALGATDHLDVAEMRVTSVVNDTDPAVPASWRELVQRRVADDGVRAVMQRSTAEMDYLPLADVDAVVHECPTIRTDVVPGPHVAAVLLAWRCAEDPHPQMVGDAAGLASWAATARTTTSRTTRVRTPTRGLEAATPADGACSVGTWAAGRVGNRTT
jgi:hypothetical protein